MASRRKATFVAEPLERGFGLTLGNSLRRVRLSSRQGAAVTAIKIEGVLHEFSSLAGVRKDVTDMVLNVKQMMWIQSGFRGKPRHIIAPDGRRGPKRLQLSATGPAMSGTALCPVQGCGPRGRSAHAHQGRPDRDHRGDEPRIGDLPSREPDRPRRRRGRESGSLLVGP
ncbi:MAG: DNA-directed polymerase subunit alpha [Sphingomonadales bacterium]|jgi:hypothetical protein|nr:DNA-directed polymerase subunit alpha [Sphingomonadales bacterium]